MRHPVNTPLPVPCKNNKLRPYRSNVNKNSAFGPLKQIKAALYEEHHLRDRSKLLDLSSAIFLTISPYVNVERLRPFSYLSCLLIVYKIDDILPTLPMSHVKSYVSSWNKASLCSIKVMSS